MVLKLIKTNQDERDYFFPGYYNGMLVVVGTKSRRAGSARPELGWFWAVVLWLAGPSSTFLWMAKWVGLVLFLDLDFLVQKGTRTLQI